MRKKVKKLDQSNMLGSIDMFYDQVAQVWSEADSINIPENYKKIDKIIINGMGGSGLGGHLVEFLEWQKLQKPIYRMNGYTLPGWVDKNTLLVLSSYSGNTEEVLTTYKEAKKKGVPMVAISSGGKLGRAIDKGDLPGYHFSDDFNPCGQPRIGIGYAVAGTLVILSKLGLFDLKEVDKKKVLNILKKKSGKNKSLEIARSLEGKIPLVVASDFLSGNAHIVANQINENSKNMANYFLISELNHHLLEGNIFPKQNTKNIQFVFIESSQNYKKNIIRTKITKKILDKQGIGYISIKLHSKTMFEQVFECLHRGSYLAFYLGLVNGVDPSPIPYVDYFKEQLKKVK